MQLHAPNQSFRFTLKLLVFFVIFVMNFIRTGKIALACLQHLNLFWEIFNPSHV